MGMVCGYCVDRELPLPQAVRLLQSPEAWPVLLVSQETAPFW